MTTNSMTTWRPTQDVPARRRPLAAFFEPRAVAVIGATETSRSVGRAVFENMTSGGFAGRVYPVNIKRSKVLGRPAYSSVQAVPETPDLAVIVTPAATVQGILRECADAGIEAAVIISAGFRETGAAGRALEQQLLAEARRTGMRLIGPNCLGLMNSHTGLNATFAADGARPGSVAFISQSGALCTSILVDLPAEASISKAPGTSPLAFIMFLAIGCPLVIARVALFLLGLVSRGIDKSDAAAS